MDNSGISYNLPGTVSGVFFTKKDADAAYEELLKLGHSHDDISVLMSDETLETHEENETTQIEDNEKNPGIVNAIISFTSMISLPGLGIAISKTLMKKIGLSYEESADKTKHVIASRIPEEHSESYHDNMKEGGIIISVDPRNVEEKRAIVKTFKSQNGHDILGDDGYTDLD